MWFMIKFRSSCTVFDLFVTVEEFAIDSLNVAACFRLSVFGTEEIEPS